MDVDNGTSETGNLGNVDIEQSLLREFSCMGTTDKDELISQLQKLIGNNLNYNAASFFLDMNNWNLQAAVCSYFDIEAPAPLPSMALANNPQANEMENVEPNAIFRKSWHVFNNGTENWPAGCMLQCASGDSLGAARVCVPCLAPGEGAILNVEMTSPTQPGVFQSKWRLCTSKGCYFGDPMWVIVTVVEEGTLALAQQLSHSHLTDAPVGANLAVPVMNPFTQPRPPSENQNITESTSEDPDAHMCL